MIVNYPENPSNHGLNCIKWGYQPFTYFVKERVEIRNE